MMYKEMMSKMSKKGVHSIRGGEIVPSHNQMPTIEGGVMEMGKEMMGEEKSKMGKKYSMRGMK